jgi:hypothetical protein
MVAIYSDARATRRRDHRTPRAYDGDRCASLRHFDRTWSEADINWETEPAYSVENDLRTLTRSKDNIAVTPNLVLLNTFSGMFEVSRS